MLTFPRTMGGYDVLIDGKYFGCLQKNTGFFVDSTRTITHVEVSADNLRRIADEAESVKKTGYLKQS